MVDKFIKSLDIIQKYYKNKNLIPADDYFEAKEILTPFIDLGAIVLQKTLLKILK